MLPARHDINRLPSARHDERGEQQADKGEDYPGVIVTPISVMGFTGTHGKIA